MNMFNKMMIFLFFMPMCSAVNAIQEIKGKVKLIETTYMPGRVMFIMDTGNAACPSGTWLKWENANQENNKVVVSFLMTSLVSGKKVAFLINDNDTTCTGRFFYLVNE